MQESYECPHCSIVNKKMLQTSKTCNFKPHYEILTANKSCSRTAFTILAKTLAMMPTTIPLIQAFRLMDGVIKGLEMSEEVFFSE